MAGESVGRDRRGCRSRSLAKAARAAGEWERAHTAEAGTVRAEDAVHLLEGEVERELSEQAEYAAQFRTGAGTEPTTADYLAAHGHGRALLKKAERRLCEQLRGGQ
ncbi:hypothetical protein [Nocardia sp. XZ_19_369]|uniref:hypothetical protein n=1 Tax=Nocardia sp. XZ_19_369 TaxID=2769487 RepID=UPI00188EDFFA|nr:hypothetical protein [Nocardia sp. XZ_19_369]